jgi:hypothetical protein
MIKNFDYKKILPDVAAIAAFLLITFIFFQPLFNGKQMKQEDIRHHLGMSKEIVDYRNAHNGEEPLWTNSMFGGMPAYQISVGYPMNLLRYIDTYVFRLRLPPPADYLFIYMVGFFILLRVLKIDPWLSLIGAVAFAFSSYFLVILQAGHNSKAHAIGYMAPTLAFMIYTFRGNYLKGGILTALFMGLELYANHPQISYYLGIIVLILGVGEFIKAFKNKTLPAFFKASAVIVAAVAVALAANIGSYLTTLEYSPYTIRGKAELTFDKFDKSSSGLDKSYATQWSYGKGETFSLMIPNVKGGPSGYLMTHKDALKNADPQMRSTIARQNSYWGDQPFTSGPVYIGAFVVFLFVFGLFVVKNELRWILLIATILSIMLAWGKNMMWFTDFFLDHFPAYNKFRAVSMILVIAELTMALLAFMALSEILKKPDVIKENKKGFYISLGLTAGLSLLFYLFPDMFFSFFSQNEIAQFAGYQQKNPGQALEIQSFMDNLKAVRIAVFKSDTIRSLIFIILGAGLLWVYSLKKIPKTAFLVVLGLIIAIDIIPVDKRYFGNDNYERKRKVQVPYQPTAADLQILQDKDPDYRVLNLTVGPWQDASTSYFHKSIGGYHGAKFRRYQDLIDYHLGKFNMQVINMLNTKYFIQKGQNGQPVAVPNYEALGNAWFVKEIKWVNNANEEITYLGKVLRVENLAPQGTEFEVYGRPLKDVDTIMMTVPVKVKSPDGKDVDEIDFSKLNLVDGQTYILGYNLADTTAGFINLSGVKNNNLIAKRQFKVTVISSFDAANQAVIDKKFKPVVGDFKPAGNGGASVRLLSYEPNHLVYESNNPEKGLAVFSEIYYPKGWKAFIDGKETPHFRVDYVLRGLVIPAGKHKIEFKFHPDSYYLGTKISFVASLIILLLLAFMVWKEVKGRKSANE